MKIKILFLSFVLLILLTLVGVLTYRLTYEQKERICDPVNSEFVFMRLYGHIAEDTWERLDEKFPDIEDTDAFRVLVKEGAYFKVVVPIALPVEWDGEAFVYRGIWPVKNMGVNR